MVAKSASKSASRGAAPASTCSQQRFKGVRMRSWGKWVSEIRLPNTRARLWLGSYNTAHQAARAFDVAVVCLRGTSATLNFPDSPPSYAPLGLPHHEIQRLAAAAAAAAATASASPAPSPCESRIIVNSDESETATMSCSSRSDESEAATRNETTGSSCCSSSISNSSATFAEPDEESEQSSSPLEAALLQEQVLNMGSEWDDLLWGFSMASYGAPWDEHLLLFPPLPAEDDLPTIFEPSLWSL